MKQHSASIEDFSRNLVYHDGIWSAANIPVFSYPADEADLYFDLESKSFWFKHRNNVILEIIIKYSLNGIILDVGGGNGFVSDFLFKNGFDSVIVEPNKNGCFNATRRGLKKIINCNLDKKFFKHESVPNICLFDVLEHIDDESAFLHTVKNILIPDGRLFISVPAYTWLWSEEDNTVGHFRRYSAGTLRQVLSSNGFKIEYQTYFFTFLILPILIFRTIPFIIRCSALFSGNKQREHSFKSFGFDPMMNLELAKIKKGGNILLGSSLLIVAKKMVSV